MASAVASQPRRLLGRSAAALPSHAYQRRSETTASPPTGAAPGANVPPPGRRSLAAKAATQMRPLPNLVGGLKSLRDISIDISEEDMSAIELRNVNVSLGGSQQLGGGRAWWWSGGSMPGPPPLSAASLAARAAAHQTSVRAVCNLYCLQEISYVSRRRMDDASFDPDAVDADGLPLVYNEVRLAGLPVCLAGWLLYPYRLPCYHPGHGKCEIFRQWAVSRQQPACSRR